MKRQFRDEWKPLTVTFNLVGGVVGNSMFLPPIDIWEEALIKPYVEALIKSRGKDLSFGESVFFEGDISGFNILSEENKSLAKGGEIILLSPADD